MPTVRQYTLYNQRVGAFSDNLPEAAGVLQLEAVFPSDVLAPIREFIQRVPALHSLLQGMIQIRLILDANVVQKELRWRLVKRRHPSARSCLHELIDSGIVVALVPRFLDSEIEDHIPDIALDTGCPIDGVRQQWDDIRSRLFWYEPQHLGARDQMADAVDPDDVPYKVACDELGADAVYSRDAHFRTMDVPVISATPDLILRSYARSSSVVMGVTLGSGLALTISFASLYGLYCLIEKTLRGFCGLPTWAKVSIAAAAFAIAAHPKSRAKIYEAWDHICKLANINNPSVLRIVGQISTQFLTAHETATKATSELKALMPQPRPRSALQHARSLCLTTKTPLSIAELESLMRAEGYTSQSKTFRGYLRRLLKESMQFVEVTPGKWSLRTG